MSVNFIFGNFLFYFFSIAYNRAKFIASNNIFPNIFPFERVNAQTSGSTTVSLTVNKEVQITAPSNFSLSGTINGVSGGVATGNAAFSVLAGDTSGFMMNIAAQAAPALVNGSYNFADYTPNAYTGTPTYAWTAPGAGLTAFGFAVGADAPANAAPKFRSSAGTCGSGSSNSASNCWSGFDGTTQIPVVQTSAFSSSPLTENIALEAQFSNGNNTSIANGTYSTTITATVSVN